MKTFNRGKLRRLCEAGKLVCVDTYHFDDMYGESRTDNEMPVCMYKADEPHRDGVVRLWEHDFKSASGCAYESGPGLVTLIVHSNSNYTFRIKP